MTSVFNLDAEVLPLSGGSDCLWSPPEKAPKTQEQCIEHHPIKFSPPSSKEAYQRIRSKYQVARSTMGRSAGSQSQSTRLVRRRQSFAISQMLQNVSTINSTPLKIGQVETDRLVDTLKASAAKRRSIVPRSCRKSRAQVLRRVSKNIDDIFASHFAGDEPEHAQSDFLTGATPHHKAVTLQQKKGVRLLERFDDDPFLNLLDESPLRSVATRPSLAGLVSPPPATTQATVSSARKATIPAATPQSQSRRNSLCSPQPSRTATTPRQSVAGSAIKLRDADFVTSSQKSSIKPSALSATPTRVLVSNRKSIAPNTHTSTSANSTPTRAVSTPAGRTPLAYYTAAGSARRPIMPTPAVSTPQRPKLAMTCSALRLKQSAAKTPVSTMRSTLHTQVQLSVEKMGAFLQSMKKNDAKFKNAALTVSKARESSPGLTRTAQKTTTARTLDYNDAPSAVKPAVQRPFVYEADGEEVGDVSGMLDDVLDINIEAMLQDYAADRLNRTGSEDHEDTVNEHIHEQVRAQEQVHSVGNPTTVIDQDDVSVDISREIPAESEALIQEMMMDITAQDLDDSTEEAEEVEMSTCEMDCTACSPTFSVNASAMDVDVDSPNAAMNGTLCDYASDSSSSPQILRVRYSAGNTSRRSLSNARGRLSLSASDCMALAATETTSPLVFTAPAAPADLLSPALVQNLRADLNKSMSRVVVTPLRSMARAPVRLLQSASKAVLSNPAMYAHRGAITPVGRHRSAYNSDSDTDLNTSLQSTGKKVIRNGNVQNSKGRRKSLACATSTAAVAGQANNPEDEDAEETAAHDTSVAKSALKSIAETSPRRTRSAVKSTSSVSALKAKELLASPHTATSSTSTPAQTPSMPTPKLSPRATTDKKAFVQVSEETSSTAGVESQIAEALSPLVEKSTKKGRKSTAKKTAPPTPADELVEVVAKVLGVLSPPVPVSKASSRKSVLKVAASPAPAPSATRAYSLRSAAKATPAEEPTRAVQTSVGRTAKTLFPEEHDEDQGEENYENSNTENAAPSNVTFQKDSTPLAKSPRTTTGKKTAAKTPVGAYTAAKVKRKERNQKLDALFGTCEELLTMIDASVL